MLSSDLKDTIKRRVRISRNLISDPYPRDHTLVFEGYEYRDQEIAFHYTALGKKFSTLLRLGNLPSNSIETIDPRSRDLALGTIGLAFAPFHFLLSDFATIRVPNIALPTQLLDFFSNYLPRGLAEFRYRQGLDPHRPIRVIGETIDGLEPVSRREAQEERILMLNGGGKDTAVMAEVLKATGRDCAWCSIGLDPHQQSIIDASGISESIVLGFRLDPNIQKFKRYSWGHMPFSGLYMAMSLLPALALGYKYVTAGNEFSANFGNLQFNGKEINHQYTKSYEFETGFDRIVRSYIRNDLRYFSALRPLLDLRIASMLQSAPAYYGRFVSCNLGEASWCARCPKCAFTYLCLAAFLESEELKTIFGGDLFDRPEIRRQIRFLLQGATKPWECVGTQEESRAAFALVHRKFRAPWMDELASLCKLEEVSKLFKLNQPHNIPEELQPAMFRKFQDMTPWEALPAHNQTTLADPVGCAIATT